MIQEGGKAMAQSYCHECGEWLDDGENDYLEIALCADCFHHDEYLCPMCGDYPTGLGELGHHTWFRCRGCGIVYNEEKELE